MSAETITTGQEAPAERPAPQAEETAAAETGAGEKARRPRAVGPGRQAAKAEAAKGRGQKAEPKAPKAPRARPPTLKHIPPDRFAAIRDKHGLKNRDLAEALGVSPSRVTELTKTKGSTERQFEAFKAAVEQYVKARPKG